MPATEEEGLGGRVTDRDVIPEVCLDEGEHAVAQQVYGSNIQRQYYCG